MADCTGHGVPGAFLTILGTTFLNEITTLNEHLSPAFTLERWRARLIDALSQSHEATNTNCMDVSLIRINSKGLGYEWSGAYNPLLLIRENGKPAFQLETSKEYEFDHCGLHEIRGDKIPIGISESMEAFTNHELQLEKGDRIYLFSDGYADQFGGNEGKKMLKSEFRWVLASALSNTMKEQGKLLENHFQ